MAGYKKDTEFEEPTRFDPERSLEVIRQLEDELTPVDGIGGAMDATDHDIAVGEEPTVAAGSSHVQQGWAPLYLDEDVLGSRSVNVQLADSDAKFIHSPTDVDLRAPDHNTEVEPVRQPGQPVARSQSGTRPPPIKVSRKQNSSESRPPPSGAPVPHRPAEPPPSTAANRYLEKPKTDSKVMKVSAPDGLLEGTQLGNYEIVRKIGQGGMGVVYEGRHLMLPRRVAIKFLLTDHSHNEEQIRRFLGEAVASSEIDHPGVVDIYDYGYDKTNSAYLIMEYVDGQSLQAIMKRSGQLPVDMCYRVVRDIALVLAAAHQRGIVHRDLKPDNVILSRDETGKDFLKILDFGVAKFVNSQAVMTGKTQAGSILGTPWYMPPEQCKGLRTIDRRSDIYALGCVFYQMVAGRVPFTGSLRDVLTAHVHSEPTPPTQFNPKVPRDVEKLILRMMAKDPEKRPASMDEIAKVLDGYSTPAPERDPEQRTTPSTDVLQPSYPAASAAKVSPPSASPQWLVPLVAGLVAGLATAAVFYYLGG